MNLTAFPWNSGSAMADKADRWFWVGNDGSRVYVCTRSELRGLEDLEERVQQALQHRDTSRWN